MIAACLSPALLIPGPAYAGYHADMVEIGPVAVVLRSGNLRLPVSLRCPRFKVDGAELGGDAPAVCVAVSVMP